MEQDDGAGPESGRDSLHDALRVGDSRVKAANRPADHFQGELPGDIKGERIGQAHRRRNLSGGQARRRRDGRLGQLQLLAERAGAKQFVRLR